MKTINDIVIKYKKEMCESSIYRKTKIDTLVYDEKYVHWLQELIVSESDIYKLKKAECVQGIEDGKIIAEHGTVNWID